MIGSILPLQLDKNWPDNSAGQELNLVAITEPSRVGETTMLGDMFTFFHFEWGLEHLERVC